jgi:hypothetical protein
LATFSLPPFSPSQLSINVVCKPRWILGFHSLSLVFNWFVRDCPKSIYWV